MINNLILIAIIVVSPLIFVPTIYDVFILEKSVFIQLFILLLFLLWVINIFKSRKILFKISAVFFFSFLFFLSLLFSLTEGFNLSMRVGVALQWGLFIWLFFFVGNYLNIYRDYRIFLFLSILVSFIVSFYAILQYSGHDFLIEGNTKPCSFFGNTNFLAEYLVSVLPFYVFWWVGTRNKWSKIIFSFSLLVVFGTLILTHSRGAWLSFMVSFMLIFCLSYRAIDLKKLGIGVLALGVLSLFVDFVFFDKLIIRNVFSLFDAEYLSNSFRVNVWQSTWQMILDHPLRGLGCANFEIIYPLYRNILEHMISGNRVEVLRAHNDFLQIMAEFGIFGIVFFLIFVMALYKKAFSFLKSRGNFSSAEWLMISLVGGFTSLLVLACYSFPLQNPVSGFYFWFLAGCIYALSSPEDRKHKLVFKTGRAFSGIVLALLMITVLSVCIINPVLASYYLKNGINYRQRGELKEASLCFDKAAKVYPGYGLAYIYNGGVLSALNEQETAIDYYEQALELLPYYEPVYAFLGDIFYLQGSYLRAKENFNGALKLNPLRSDLYVKMGNVLLKEENYNEAGFWFFRGKKINPKDEYARIGWASVLLRKGNIHLAIAEYEEVIKINPRRSDVYTAMGDLYLYLNDYDKAMVLWEEALAVDPAFTEAKKKIEALKDK